MEVWRPHRHHHHRLQLRLELVTVNALALNHHRILNGRSKVIIFMQISIPIPFSKHRSSSF